VCVRSLFNPAVAQNTAVCPGESCKACVAKAVRLPRMIENSMANVSSPRRGRSGRIDLQTNHGWTSPAFQVTPSARARWPPAFTNSPIQIPVSVFDRTAPQPPDSGLLPAQHPTQTLLTRAADFLVMKGTVGRAERKRHQCQAFCSGWPCQNAGAAVGGSTGSNCQNLAGGVTSKSSTNNSSSPSADSFRARRVCVPQ